MRYTFCVCVAFAAAGCCFCLLVHTASSISHIKRNRALLNRLLPLFSAAMPAMYSLWIVGRNGGLLYSRVRAIRFWPSHLPPCLTHSPERVQDFLPLPPIEFNDKLRLASSW